MRTVTAKWANEHRDTINIIDVRGPEEFAQGHIEGSINVPGPGLIFNTEQFINRREEYYLICRSGARSLAVAEQLDAKGYNVINVEGGNAAIGNA